MGIEGEGALSITVVGCVAFRSNDPVLRETQQTNKQTNKKKHSLRKPVKSKSPNKLIDCISLFLSNIRRLVL